MCKYCEIKKGDDFVVLADKNIEFKVGGQTIMEHLLSIGLDIDRNDGHILEVDYFFDSYDNAVAKIKLPIKYGPFCGRSLID